MPNIYWNKIKDPTLQKWFKRHTPDGQSPLRVEQRANLDPRVRDEVDKRYAEAIAKGQIKPGPGSALRNAYDKSGQRVSGYAAPGTGAGDERYFSPISTAVSRPNLVELLLSDTLCPRGPGNYRTRESEALSQASKFVFCMGYELDREDLVDTLIAKARAGVQVGVLFDPADAADEKKKKALLGKLYAAQRDLPNLHVAEYKVVERDPKQGFEQIQHVKRLITDTPDGSMVELSGGINFNEHSVRNLDFGWCTEGVAAWDSLQLFLLYFELATGRPPSFDLSVVPSTPVLTEIASRKAAQRGEALTTIEVAAAGKRHVLQPPPFSQAGLWRAAQSGERIVIAAADVIKRGVLDLLIMARRNGSVVDVLRGGLSPEQEKKFDKLLPELRAEFIQVNDKQAVVQEDGVKQLYYDELDHAIARRERIYATEFALSEAGVLDRLIKAHQAGAEVRVVVDDLTIGGHLVNNKAMARLSAAGVPIRVMDKKAKAAWARRVGTDPGRLKLHSKLIIIGGNRVLGGSANRSDNGFNNNVEDARVVRSPQVAQFFERHLFEPVWESATPIVPDELVEDARRVPLLPAVKMDTAVKDTRFIVFDLETTGFRPENGDRILSISAQVVKVRGDGSLEVVDTFKEYVDPGMNPLGEPFQVPKGAASVHGLTNEELKKRGARPLSDVMAEFVRFVQKQGAQGNVVLAGQNVRFDLRFVDHALSRVENGQEVGGAVRHYLLDAPFVDTRDISRRLFPKAKSHELDAQMLAVGVEIDPSLPNRHDAYADVVYTARVLGRMVHHGQLARLRELMGPDVIDLGAKVPAYVPVAFTTTPGGEQVAFDIVRNSAEKLTVRAPSRVAKPNKIAVVGRSGEFIKVEVTVGTGSREQVLRGFVPASLVGFKDAGTVYYELREQGVALARPSSILTSDGPENAADPG